MASLLIGLAHVALLPPWEGYDETAHFSYIQQVAETGRWPWFGDKMSKDIDDYLEVAPVTESMGGPSSYYRFFSGPADVVTAASDLIQSRPAKARAWVPGKLNNWQAQHPPLYYLAMAPAYLATKSSSLAVQLFVLRAFSYLLGWAALCLVAVAALSGHVVEERAAKVLPLGVAAWPFLFPMWFPEIGRLGNDSLIAAFAACVLLLGYRLSSFSGMRWYALLGIILGLGMLTKATFLSVVIAVLAILFIQAVVARKVADQRSARLKGLFIAAAILIGICGWWYALKFIETGSIIGAGDAVQLRLEGGMLAGIMKHLQSENLVLIAWGIAVSFLWNGTWSFVLPPRIAMVPLIAMTGLIAYGCYRFLRRYPLHAIDGFALLVLGLFAAGLAYHSLILFSIVGNAAGAWYLHSVAPILALLAGYGLFGMLSIARLRAFLAALLFYPILFLPAVTLLNALYFAGCAPKLPGRAYFAWSSAANCLAEYPKIYENLSVLAFPGIATGMFVIGWTLAILGMITALMLMRENVGDRHALAVRGVEAQ